MFIFSRIANPDPKNPNSIPTFGYRNVLPLSKNSSYFQVRNEPIFLPNSSLILRMFSHIGYCPEHSKVIIFIMETICSLYKRKTSEILRTSHHNYFRIQQIVTNPTYDQDALLHVISTSKPTLLRYTCT